MTGIVCIQTYRFRHEAESAQKFLENLGIQAEILADDCGGMEPGMLGHGTVRLMVKEEDTQRANEALKDDGRRGQEREVDDPDSLERLKLEIRAKGARTHLILSFTFILIGLSLAFMFGRGGGFIGLFFALIGLGGLYSYRESLRARGKLRAGNE